MNWNLLKDAAVDVVVGGLTDEEMWGGLRDGAWYVMVLIVRLLLLVIFPISVPLIAWMIVHDRQRYAQQQAEFRERVRREMHQSRPVAPSHTTNKENG